MVRYPKRPWFHPAGFMSHNPAGYTIGVFCISMLACYPWRHKIARYYERQRDPPGQAVRQQAVRHYKHLEAMWKREILYKQPFVNEEQPYARIGQHVTSTSFLIGIVDTELDYWTSHQRDVQRAAKLTDELRELKARQGNAVAAASANSSSSS